MRKVGRGKIAEHSFNFSQICLAILEAVFPEFGIIAGITIGNSTIFELSKIFNVFDEQIEQKIDRQLHNAIETSIKKVRKKYKNDSEVKQLLVDFKARLSQSFSHENLLLNEASFVELLRDYNDDGGDLQNERLLQVASDFIEIFNSEILSYDALSSAILQSRIISLQERLAEVQEQIHMKKECPVVLTKYPVSFAEKLIGRDIAIEKIYTKICDGENILVSGIAGVGKTEVAIKVFYRIFNEIKENSCFIRHLGWITYTGDIKSALIQALHKELENQSIQPTWDGVFEFLSEFGSDLLIFVDNFDERKKSAELQLLSNLGIRLCVTSRCVSLPNIPAKEKILKLSKPNCRKIFRLNYTNKVSNELLDRIIELTDHHTLSINLLSRIAQNNRLSIPQMIDHLEKKEYNMKYVHKNKGDYIQEICKLFDFEIYTDAQKKVLFMFSLLPQQYLSDELICNWFSIHSFEPVDRLIWSGWIQAQNCDNDLNVTYVMHPVLAAAVRKNMYNTKQACQLTRKIYHAISGCDTEPYVEVIWAINYAQEIITNIKEDSKEKADLMNDLAMLLRHMGQYDLALKIQESCVEIYRKILGESHRDYASAVNNLGLIKLDSGSFRSSIRLLKKALRLRETHDAGPRLLGFSYNDIANYYYTVRDYKKSAIWAQKAVDVTNSLPKTRVNQISHANHLHNLAVILAQNGRNTEAKENQMEAIKIRKKYTSIKDNRLSQSYSSLSIIHANLKQYPEALNANQDAIDVLEKGYPSTYIGFANLYQNRARILQDYGNFDDALIYIDRCIGIRVANKYNKYMLVRDLLTKARVLRDLKDYKKAENIVKMANNYLDLESSEKVIGLKQEVEDLLKDLEVLNYREQS